MSPDVLEIATVVAALLWAKAAKDEDALKKQVARLGYLRVLASKYDSDHHFGPVMTLEAVHNGTKQSLEIIVPWHKVLAVVRDRTGKLELGFKPEG